MADRKIPAPGVNPETEPFWTAAREGRFLVKGCASCGKNHWYPRAICPFCFSDRTEWRPASGRGVIYSLSVMKRAPEPYVMAYVTLEEGPTMMTNIVDCDFDALKIGQKVKLVFKPTEGDGPPFPMFTPA
ncbi:DNA-binding protein [Caldovatus sediminis]|uniref:DNA-binding protein n=1 Tax=Caldovatus sediminis TaxID=2041189 RepID=A0A8J3EB38_9PROT|nr:Zn-ribbon domain-containing OB-fold protein [Caldovatus sediminis]GGG19269.1 DNA-binding protein [Caldovatus sediminis]